MSWKKELQGISWLLWIIKIIPIPVGIINSILIADIALRAVDGNVHNVLTSGAALLGLYLVAGICTGALEMVYGKRRFQILHCCKMKLYGSFLNSPLYELYGISGGKIKEMFNDDFATVTNRHLKWYPELWTAAVTTILYFCFIFAQSPVIAIILIAISVIQAIPPMMIKRYMQVNYDETREIEADITDFIMEGINGFATIKLFHLKEWWMKKLEQKNARYRKIGNRSIYTAETETAMNSFVANILQYGTYGIIGILILKQYAAISAGVQAIALSESFFTAVKTVFSVYPHFAVSRVADRRVREICGECPKRAGIVEKGIVRLECASVCFGEKSVFKDVSVNWKQGEKIVVKGINGSGKSTLLRSLLGLIHGYGGDIFIDNVRPEDLSIDNFPRRICYLPQEDLMLSITAEELYDQCLETPEQALAQARLMGIPDDILRTVRIDKLSGGQCKKVYLALGISTDAQILCLDEPTNSLDEKGKHGLCSMLKEYAGTVILITHEGIFDEMADHIYCMKGDKLQIER